MKLRARQMWIEVCKCGVYGILVFLTFTIKKTATMVLFKYHSEDGFQADPILRQIYLSATRINSSALVISLLLVVLLLLGGFSIEGKIKLVYAVVLAFSIINCFYALITMY